MGQPNVPTTSISNGTNQPRIPIFRFLLLYSIITIIPLTLIAVVLLAIIYTHSHPGVFFTSPTSASNYYVTYSLSSILLVSSWAATVSVLLAGFVMSLFSFIYARSWLSGDTTPTPQQHALAVQATSFGGVGSLWKLINYAIGAGKHRAWPHGLKLAVTVLSTALLAGWGVAIADSWLHGASSTELFISHVKVPLGERNEYGRRMSDYCIRYMASRFDDDGWPKSDNGGLIVPCNLNPAMAMTYIQNGTEGMKTVMGSSSKNAATLVDGAALLVEKNPDPAMEFRANTWGVEVSCQPITSRCGLKDRSGHQTLYNCASDFPLFKGNNVVSAITNNTDFVFANDSTGSVELYEMSMSSRRNRLTFGVISSLFRIQDRRYADSDVFYSMWESTSAIFKCQMDIFTAEYTMSNGTIRDVVRTPANSTLSRIITGVSELDVYWRDIARTNLNSAYTASDTAQEMASRFAGSFAQMWIGMTAGSTESAVNLEQARIREHLVAVVPKAPLWFLCTLCFLYSWGALILAAWAVRMVVLGDNQTVGRAQMWLSVEALAARTLGPVGSRVPAGDLDGLFEENDGRQEKTGVVITRNDLGGMDMHLVSEAWQ